MTIWLACTAVAAVLGCSSSAEPDETSHGTAADVTEHPSPRPLTTDEAQRLAMMRFSNFDAGTRAVQFSVRDSGQEYTLNGWVDFTAKLGYANLHGGSGDDAPLLLAWTKETVSSHEGAVTGDLPPLPPPNRTAGNDAWTSSALAPEASRLHTVLAIVLSTSNDRPDNPLLLQQTDARWLRSDELDGVAVDVLLGPTSDEPYDAAASDSAGDGSDATVRYWIDDAGVLQRMELRLGGGGEWTVVDFTEAPDIDFAGTLFSDL
ncbi:hypothetical protein [Phytoactinopolyspora mesophila]|uniref:LppX_LprAFG lipoprotein n=1 Tax=Phytoactinopolyspora mesophila TaxID=2650750 RepID=A0A7K3M5K0_9ACTN|nr:hypothetical protein [Phytoactinopolyspora mesophila]NDL58594.1 hypothetical protein [Phytoactinopolyspora mesophila]